MVLKSVHVDRGNGASASAAVEPQQSWHEHGSIPVMKVDPSLQGTRAAGTGLESIPQDVLIQIAIYMDPWGVVRCQGVSKSWRQAFSDPYLLEQVLRHNLKNSCEVRTWLQQGLSLEEQPIVPLFRKLACRYFHLTSAKPCSILSLKLLSENWPPDLSQDTRSPLFYPIGPWEFHRSRNWGLRSAKPRTIFDQAFWTYDEGLVIYPAAEEQKLMILDLDTESSETVPFDLEDRVVRNIRLKCGLLVVEWAESKPFHALNTEVPVHRHFVTIFQVFRTSQEPPSTHLSIRFYAELRLHFLGLPLLDQDRFFSTHTSHHYAVYFWQPNRSMYTGNEEEPIEALLIWDISSPSTYRPSLDPSGSSHPNILSGDSTGPKAIARLSFRDLDYYDLRQRNIPAFMTLSLDSSAGTLCVRENQKFYTPGYFDPAERRSRTSATIIPFRGYGPYQYIAHDNSNFPPYVGNCSLETDEDQWADQTWVENWFNVVDRDACVMFSLAQTKFRHQDALNWTMIRIMAMEREVGMDEKTAKLVTGKGKLAGDERWLIGEADGVVSVLRFDR